MDKVETQKILSEQMERFSRRDYSELQRLVESKHVEDFEVPGASGTRYGVEVQFFWDDKRKGGSVSYIEGVDRQQGWLLPERLEDYVSAENPVRFLDAFVDSLDLTALGFQHAQPQATGRPPYRPGDPDTE